MPISNRGGWKTCNRGHHYRGSDPCPSCWPGGAKRARSRDKLRSSGAPDDEGSRAVDAYIHRLPSKTEKRLEEIRAIIKRNAPEAIEKISYQMPAFFLNRALVWYAAFEHHIGFYPGASGVAAFNDEIGRYKHAKGSIQFPHDKPLPVALIKRIVKFRLKENLRKRRTS